MLHAVPTYALSAIGPDRPGIVAGVTRVLLDHGVNVEDSQATILRGHFAITLVAAAGYPADEEALRRDLDDAASRLGLEALTLREIGDLDSGPPEPTHIVTVYGADHPGIVHAAALALAGAGANITDLNTRLVSDGGDVALYAVMIEVALTGPEGELRDSLEEVAESETVEVNLRELEQDEP
jgi:glycine cleavage system transcriptional repressor